MLSFVVDDSLSDVISSHKSDNIREMVVRDNLNQNFALWRARAARYPAHAHCWAGWFLPLTTFNSLKLHTS
jgi:hypothetical protein